MKIRHLSGALGPTTNGKGEGSCWRLVVILFHGPNHDYSIIFSHFCTYLMSHKCTHKYQHIREHVFSKEMPFWHWRPGDWFYFGSNLNPFQIPQPITPSRHARSVNINRDNTFVGPFPLVASLGEHLQWTSQLRRFLHDPISLDWRW